jgi:hypothetical protein
MASGEAVNAALSPRGPCPLRSEVPLLVTAREGRCYDDLPCGSVVRMSFLRLAAHSCYLGDDLGNLFLTRTAIDPLERSMGIGQDFYSEQSRLRPRCRTLHRPGATELIVEACAWFIVRSTLSPHPLPCRTTESRSSHSFRHSAPEYGQRSSNGGPSVPRRDPRDRRRHRTHSTHTRLTTQACSRAKRWSSRLCTDTRQTEPYRRDPR